MRRLLNAELPFALLGTEENKQQRNCAQSDARVSVSEIIKCKHESCVIDIPIKRISGKFNLEQNL